MEETSVQNKEQNSRIEEELRLLRAEIAEIRLMFESALIQPKSSYLDNAHRNRIIAVLRDSFELPFNEICQILPQFYPEWKFTPNTIAQAFYRYKKSLPPSG